MKEYPVEVSVEEAVEKLLGICPSVKTETVCVQQANGRILAADMISGENIPPFCRSPYDGYALRFDDVLHASEKTPVTLSIIEEIPAGYAPVKTVESGQASKILTGAPVPAGANAIVKFEDTVFDRDSVTLFSPVKPGSNIVPAGEDVKIGDCVLKKGTRITPAMCGLLAGLGFAQIPVYKKLRISLISTGDELVSVEESITPGKIRNSSVYTIQSYLEEWGMEVYLHGIEKDDVSAIARAMEEESSRADVILTTGGVSVGDYDCIADSVERLGARILFWKLKMKPGMAFLASVYKDTLILSLSGNPSSAAISLFMVGKPVLKQMAGSSKEELSEKPFKVLLKNGFPKSSPGRRFIPGKLEIIEGKAYLNASPKQGNGMLSPLHGCDILGEIPAGSPALEKGSVINAYRV